MEVRHEMNYGVALVSQAAGISEMPMTMTLYIIEHPSDEGANISP